jgi:hypothetical protein
MQRYLVMCKDDAQWEEYLSKVKHSMLLSKTTRVEERQSSFILHYQRVPNEVFIKVTPTDQYALTLYWEHEKIWLCYEGEFILGDKLCGNSGYHM